MKTDTSLPAAARFWIKSRIRAPAVSPEPHFDAEGLHYFKHLFERAGLHYLEFGSGGSTRYADGRVSTLVSVESDANYLAAVARTLTSDSAVLFPVDIGITHEWGRPVFIKPTPKRIAKWMKYPEAPWAYFHERQIQPDIVLVDGRFRVASALSSLVNIDKDFRLLVDDYDLRPHYHVITEFADLAAMHGRMAEFHPRPRMDQLRCREIISLHYADFR